MSWYTWVHLSRSLPVPDCGKIEQVLASLDHGAHRNFLHPWLLGTISCSLMVQFLLHSWYHVTCNIYYPARNITKKCNKRLHFLWFMKQCSCNCKVRFNCARVCCFVAMTNICLEQNKACSDNFKRHYIHVR